MGVGSGFGLAVAWVGTAAAGMPVAADQPASVVDRAKAHVARRALFGFDFSHHPRYGESVAAADGMLGSIDSIITVASRAATGRWLVILADHGRWEEVDSLHASGTIEAGMPIVIRRAPFGSYVATVGDDVRLRMRRVA